MHLLTHKTKIILFRKD